MAEQHAIGGGERQRVAGRLLPRQMRGLRHELARLHAAELRERAVRRLVTPDALRGRQQRIAAVAVLVVAVVLIAVDDDLVADLPAPHLGADRPDHAGGVGAGDVERMLVDVERRDRHAEAGPDAVVVDARRHHVDQHLVLADRPGRHHFELHGGFRRAVALLADRPGVHLFGHMAERRDFADAVQVFDGGRLRRLELRDCGHGVRSPVSGWIRQFPAQTVCDSLVAEQQNYVSGVKYGLTTGVFQGYSCCLHCKMPGHPAAPHRRNGRTDNARQALDFPHLRRPFDRRLSRTRSIGKISPRARPACRSPSICRPRPATTATTCWRAARSARSACRSAISATCARCSTAFRSPR